jgi:hypothetical protein
MIYGPGDAGWRRIHQEESGFTNRRAGYTEVAFSIPTLAKGLQKLELVITGPRGAIMVPHLAEIEYRVE